jgi:hypothetical protein
VTEGEAEVRGRGEAFPATHHAAVGPHEQGRGRGLDTGGGGLEDPNPAQVPVPGDGAGHVAVEVDGDGEPTFAVLLEGALEEHELRPGGIVRPEVREESPAPAEPADRRRRPPFLPRRVLHRPDVGAVSPGHGGCEDVVGVLRGAREGAPGVDGG